MALTRVIGALGDRAERLSEELHRHWMAQVVVAFVGTLYLVNASLASLIAQKFSVSLELITIVVPILSFYNFVRMGYLTGGYFLTRAELGRLVRAQSDALSLGLATENYSGFRYLTHVMTDDDDIPYLPGGNRYRLPAIAVVVFLAVGVFSFSNGLAVYFLFTLTEGWRLWARIFVIVIPGGLLFSFFYLHFIFGMHSVLKARSMIVWISMAMFWAILVFLLVRDLLSAARLAAFGNS